MHRKLFYLFAFIICFSTARTIAASLLPITPEQQANTAIAIFCGEVLENASYRNENDGGIYSRTVFRVDEALKGKFPAQIQLKHRGGIVGEEGEVDSFSPRFLPGEKYLIFLARHSDGTLFSINGTASCYPITDENEFTSSLLHTLRETFPNAATAGEDVSDQGVSRKIPISSVVGGLLESSGVSARFIAPDRGEAIPYLVDAQTLPAGITLTQALNAVSNAFKAWSDVSSVRFQYEGTENFGQSSANVSTTDRKIRVQLHDLYNFITETNILGKGGRAFAIPGLFPNGGNGGKIGTREFFESTRGYVVLKHTAASMQNLNTFTEVLCHEIGHVLSLDHSSETNPEANTTLREAMMYYQIHADGRGATLGAYDPPVVRLLHPFNTPPYSFDRIIDLVTASTAPNVAGINEVVLRGYDLQGDVLSISTTNATASSCNFSLQGNLLKATPNGYWNGARIDPATSSFYDRVYIRFQDATNASPFVLVRTISLMPDSQPSGGSDGLPDSWMTTYFGTTMPSAGAKTRSQDDYDNDGVSNLNEFISGTDPTNPNSVIRISSFSTNSVQWIAKPYDLYEVLHSTNLTSWSRVISVLPTTAAGTIAITNSAPHNFFRIERVP